MRRFLQTFAICLVVVEVFIFFGGWQLFDFNRHWFLAGASIAVVLAVFISVWLSQEDRLEALEKRIKELEEQQVQKEKQQ